MAHAQTQTRPAWWTNSAYGSPVNSSLTTPENQYSIVNQGQVKQFTVAAVKYMNATLPSLPNQPVTGAGSDLNNLVAGWKADYQTNGQNANDFKAMNIGQLKYIANLVWARLIAAGYTGPIPNWLQTSSTTDNYLADIGQLKTVFYFDLTSFATQGPRIISPATVTASLNQTFSYPITATGNPTTYMATTPLPAGLSLTGNVIGGKPTALGTTTVNLTVSNGINTGQGVVVINVVSNSSAPVINSASTAQASSGSSFAYQITASNSPTQYGATNLPAGLTYNSLTGTISGTVTISGTSAINYSVGLSAANSQGTATGSLSLTINPSQSAQALAPVLTIPDNVPVAVVGQQYSLPLIAVGATSFSATGLPANFSIDSTGTIKGTPGGTSWGTYQVVVTATGTGTASVAFNLTVEPNVGGITSPATAYATVGTGFTYSLTSNLNPATYTASLNGNSWLTFNPASGILSGTPTQTGAYMVTLGASNSAVNATQTLTIQVTGTPVITSPTAVSATVDTAFAYQIQTLNPATGYQLTAAAGSSIPKGLVFNPTQGILSGTPVATGTYTLNLTATSASGPATATLTLNVGFGLGSVATITSPGTAYGKAGTLFSYPIVGDNLPSSFSVTGQPSWLSLQPNGVLTGTPPAAGVSTVTISAISTPNGTAVAPLTIVIGSATTTTSATVPLQAGIFPTLAYATTSATIAMDPANASLLNQISAGLAVGNPSGTELERALVGFDLSVLPADADVKSVSLTLTAENVGSSGTTTTLNVYSPSVPFSPGVDTWTIDNGKGSLLSSLTTATVSGTTTETWANMPNFAAAANAAIQQGQPLDLVILSSSAESAGTTSPSQFFQFDDETNRTVTSRPQLTVTYTTSAPPVIAPIPPLYVTSSGLGTGVQVSSLNGATYSGSGVAGLSISSTGKITGNPTASGTFTITATNKNGSSTQAIAVNLGALPVVTSGTTATATVGSIFTPYTATASNNPSSVQISGTLPAGLTLNAAGNVLSGTPNNGSDGSYSLTITATNAYGSTTAPLTLTVKPIAPVISGPLPGLFGNQGIYLSASVSATGNPTSFTLSPNLTNIGLSVDNYGYVSGTINTGTPVGTYNGTLSCTNAAGTSPTVPLSVTVSALPKPTIPSQTLYAVQGVAFNGSVNASVAVATNSQGVSATNFSPASLPDGFTMDGSGNVSGMPGSAGTFTATVSAQDASGMGSGTLNLVVYPPGPGISGPLTQATTVGQSFSYTLTTVQSTATSTNATGLPPGLTFQDGGSYGTISGTPTIPGVYSVTLSATDSSSHTSTNTLVITVAAIDVRNAQIGSQFSYPIVASGQQNTFQSPVLPANGLSLNATTGVISGTPLAAGTMFVPYTVTGSVPLSGIVEILISANVNDDQLDFQAGVSPSPAYQVSSVSIAQDANNAAAATQSYATGTTTPVGEIVSPASGTSTADSRALFSFDLSALPAGATITSAALVVQATAGVGSGVPLEVHQTGGFDPASATWNSNSGYNQTVLAATTLPVSQSGPVTLLGTLAFTQAVQQTVAAAGQTLNLELMAPGAEGQATVNYVNVVTQGSMPTSNPQLIVTYTYPNQAPVITSPAVYAGPVNQPVNFQLTATNLAANLTGPFSVSGLPPTLTLNAATGLITGSVSTVGSVMATLTVSNGVSPAIQQLTLNFDNASPANGLSAVSGNNQVGLPNTFLTLPLTVQALSGTNPATNRLVTFTTPVGALSATNTGTPTASSLSVVTNNTTGQAQAYLYLPANVATIPVTVTSGTAAPVQLTETSALQTSSSSNLVLLSVVSGANQTGPAGQMLLNPIVVRAVNAQGQPVVTALTFQVVQGSGTITGGSTLITGVNGQASLRFSPGGANGAINQIACTTPHASPIAVMTQVASGTASSIPNAGSAKPPVTDLDRAPASQSMPPYNPDVQYNYLNESVTISGFRSQDPLYLTNLLFPEDGEYGEYFPTSNLTAFSISNGTYLINSYHPPPDPLGQFVFEESTIQYTAQPDGSGTLGVGSAGAFYSPENNQLLYDVVNFSGGVNFTGATSSFNILDNEGSTVTGSYLWINNSNKSNLGEYLRITPNDSAQPGDTLTVTYQLSDSFDGYNSSGKVQFVVPTPKSNLNVSIDEASGSRYRKIALNGLPLADEKPQQSAESDQEKEESYIDALTGGLRHSTTDVYLPVSGSDLTVSARRDVRSQVWSVRHGLRPHEQPDLPFGVGWSSNLAANIRFTGSNDPASQTPPQAIVTDESGGIHTFLVYNDGGVTRYFPMPSARNEQQPPNLETLAANTTTTPATYIFQRKYGTTLTYQATPLNLSTSEDRTQGSSYQDINQYARLIQAVDRLGNAINYQYVNATTLVPSIISVANQPQTRLYIQQEVLGSASKPQSVVSAIWDAKGNETTYSYTPFATGTGLGATTAFLLTGVTAPDGSTTTYTYSAQAEPDLMPHASSDPGNYFWHADLASIADPLGNTYGFTYALDHSKLNYMNNSQVYTGYYVQCGAPRIVAQVSLPDHQGKATFSNANSLVYVVANNVQGTRKLVATDANNYVHTYRFGTPALIPIPTFPGRAGFSNSFANTAAYTTLDVDHGSQGTYLGTEEFKFNLNAAMALSSVSDLSGNKTTYAQTDAWTSPTDYQTLLKRIPGVALNGYYNDPNQETDALGYIKTFQYDPALRIMTDLYDNNRNHTHYGLDTRGRRTSEIIYDSHGTKLQETDFFYTNAAYPGFMTQKTVAQLDNVGTWEKSLITKYVPDSNGHIYQEIVDPGGLALTTTYSYDANGNKLSEINPRGYTTWYNYDSRNRLTTVTYADGSQRQMVYDKRGNKTADIDENGFATLYLYDAFNRGFEQARDMNGNGVIDPGTDLVTQYSYNEVNSKLSVTSPNGATTRMTYDNLQRLTQIVDVYGHTTKYAYGANSGGNAFDSSSFKPTQITEPRGYITTVQYDSLYRAISKAVQYDPARPPSTTSMGYDANGNVTSMTDPVGNQTTISYDGLNRPLVTTYADTFTLKNSYTSTGFKWQVIDPNGNVTQTQFDSAGRATAVTSGFGTAVASTVSTSYDGDGNAVESVDPRFYATDNVFDARDRKVQEFEPVVLDAFSNQTLRPTTTWKYDLGGRLTGVIDPRGNQAAPTYETDTVYDPANRVTDINQPAVSVNGGASAVPNTHKTYDFDGNVLTLRDANGHTTTNTYDLLDRLTATTTTPVTGNDIKVKYIYDQVGNRLLVTDGLGQSTAFVYDGLNRNTQITDAAGKATLFTYDGLNKTQRIDALGQTTSYFYDLRNRLQYVIYASSNTTFNPARTYSYDNDGNILFVTESGKGGAANAAYLYDALNRVSYETSQGVQHHYVYDAAGNRTQTTYGSTSRQITSIYDALNRLTTMVENSRLTGYSYDLDGNIKTKTLPNGDQENSSFDPLNRAASQAGTKKGGGALYMFGYGYDLVGNVTYVTETYLSGLNNRTVANSYDGTNRLTIETVTGNAPNATTTYGYDNANNRTSKAITGIGAGTTNYNYNNLNQLIGATGQFAASYTYDLDGNRATRTFAGSTDNYTYDFENRLVSLFKNTTGSTGTYNYTYDYRTRRVVRDESSASGFKTQLVFSGGTSVQEYGGTITTGNLAVEYVRGSDYGGGVGGILYTIHAGTSSPYFTHTNRRGDVVAQTDSDGNLKNQAQYSAFGNRVATSGTIVDRQKSNSKDTDPTGLVDEGMRYRDLDTGMFINRDPAGFVDGPNLYTYVRQNPWTSFDAEGLMTQDQYQQDQSAAEAKLNSHIADMKKAAGGKPIHLAGDKESNDLIAQINKDKAGISGIQKTAREMSMLAETQVNASQLDDATADYKSFRSTMDATELNPANNIAMYAAQGHPVYAAGEFAKDTAESLAVGKLFGLAFKALRAGGAPLAKVLQTDAQGFSGVYDSSTGKIGLKPSSYDQPTPAGFVPARGGHAVVSQELGGDAANHSGFAVIPQADGSLQVTWTSRTLNNTPDAMVPPEQRQAIVKAIEQQTGRSVSSH